MNLKTLTGLSLADVAHKLDEELPPEAYTRIPGAVDLTDIDPGYMRRVLNAVFGLCGYGWGYKYHPADLELTFGDKNVLALMKQMTFWYLLADDDGQNHRKVVMASGASENRTPAYAMKGALTNALGNAVSNLGFQESVYLGKRSHATVGRKNGAGKSPPPSPTPAKNGSGAKSKVSAPASGEAADNDPGDFVIPIGTQHKGKAVKDLPAEALIWFAEKMATTTPAAQETKAMCAAYLAAQREVRPHPEMRPHSEMREPRPA